MKRILILVAFVAAMVTLMSGLQSCKSVKAVDKSELAGDWTLKSLNGEDAKVAFSNTVPHFQFNFENNTLAGNSGCNNFSGGFTLTPENKISAPTLISTRKACLNGNKEPQFLQALSTPNLVLSLDKDNVLSFSKDKAVVLQFVKGSVSTGASIIDVTALSGAWTLSSMAGEDISELFSMKTPTIEFLPENRASGNAGCNIYRTSYAQDGNTLTFGAMMLTKRACPSLKGEGLYTSLFSTPFQVELNGDKLIFLKDGNMVLEFTKGVAE